jgi:nucleoside-diphosphate-sugar epimerase
MSSTWFITGASRGLGRELAEQVLARGASVAATLRTPSQLDDLVAAHGDRLWVRQLDVTDSMQMGQVVEEALSHHERIDVVVSNAGFGVFGAAEDLTTDQVQQMIATNLTAAIHLLVWSSTTCVVRVVADSCSYPAWEGTLRSLLSRSTTPPSGALRAFMKPDSGGRAVRHSHDIGRARHDPHQLL